MVQNVLFMSLRIMLRAPLTVIGSLVMAFVVSAKVSPLSSHRCTGSACISFILWRRTGVKYFSRIQKRLDGVNRVIQENLQAVRLVKAYLRGMYEASRFSKVADMLRNDTVKAMRLMELILPILIIHHEY